MAGEVLVNMSDVISSLPSYIFERFDNLVLILQAVGIAFIVYIIYIIIHFNLNVNLLITYLFLFHL